MTRAKPKGASDVTRELARLELAARAKEIADSLAGAFPAIERTPAGARVDLARLRHVPVPKGRFAPEASGLLVLLPGATTTERRAWTASTSAPERQVTYTAREIDVAGLCFHGLRICGACLPNKSPVPKT